MRTLDSFTDLHEAARSYRQGMPEGIAVDHVYCLDHLGYVKRIGDTEWVVPHAGGRAFKVVCGDLVEERHEDGVSITRCGAPIVPGGTGCPGHDLGPDHNKECEHGLSLALCAGPMHYPPDPPDYY